MPSQSRVGQENLLRSTSQFAGTHIPKKSHSPFGNEAATAGEPVGVALPMANMLVQRMQDEPSSLSSGEVMYLQRTLGNRTVSRLLQRDQSSPIQRHAQVGPDGGTLDHSLEGRIRQAQSGGQSLPISVRRALEPKLGTDLGGVKIHTDKNAVQLSRELGAKAFTHQQHIFYGAGQSPHDLQLTAHETAHTIQQGAVSSPIGAKMPGIQRNIIQRKKKGSERNVDPNQVKQTLPDTANKFKLTLSVWQDDANFLWNSTKFVVKKAFSKLFKTKSKPKPPSSTGHSWVELRAFNDNDLVFSDSYGFMPGGIKHPDPFHGDQSNGKDNDTLYKDYEISKDQFANVIATAEAVAQENPKYDLKDFNCTKFARLLVHSAGLKFIGNRVVPGAKVGVGKSFTPNRLYSAMKSRQKKGKAYALDQARKDLPKSEPVKELPDVKSFVDDTALVYMKEGDFDYAKNYVSGTFYEDLTPEMKESLALYLGLTLEELHDTVGQFDWQ